MNEVDSIATHLKSGEVALVPFDTCYGLVCDATNADACSKLYQLKQRPRSKPSAIVVPDVETIKKYAVVSDQQERILNNILPGKVTVIMQAQDNISLPRGFVVTKYKTLSFRIVNDNLIKDILAKLKQPILATSANITGKPVILCRSDFVMHGFNNARVERVLTCFSETFERPSHTTVVDLTTDDLEIIRPGAVSSQELLLN